MSANPRCFDLRPGLFPLRCMKPAGHTGPHQGSSFTWWNNEHATPGVEPCGHNAVDHDSPCTRPAGHDGAHGDGQQVWCGPAPINTAGCWAFEMDGRRPVECVLPSGHDGDHTDANGTTTWRNL